MERDRQRDPCGCSRQPPVCPPAAASNACPPALLGLPPHPAPTLSPAVPPARVRGVDQDVHGDGGRGAAARGSARRGGRVPGRLRHARTRGRLPGAGACCGASRRGQRQGGIRSKACLYPSSLALLKNESSRPAASAPGPASPCRLQTLLCPAPCRPCTACSTPRRCSSPAAVPALRA